MTRELSTMKIVGDAKIRAGGGGEIEVDRVEIVKIRSPTAMFETYDFC